MVFKFSQRKFTWS